MEPTKVLIADDSELNVKILSDILLKKGYAVRSTGNGLAVFDLAKEFRPDLILLDIVMPDLDGFQVCSRLKHDPVLGDVPVIMVTSRTDGKDIKESLELGAYDFIKKPIDEMEVIARAEAALRHKEQQDRLRELATKDVLTGLYNRAFLLRALENQIQDCLRYRTGIAFVMVDIDHFKKVNDSFGHPAGDFVLRKVAQILAEKVAKGGIAGRYGGEEFGLILRESSIAGTMETCETIRKEIAGERFDIGGGGSIGVTVSLGICYQKGNVAIDLPEMINRADQALYDAKHNGRNRAEIG